MDKQTYEQKTAEIRQQILALQQQEEELKSQYLSQFPKVGDLVLYKGVEYHVYSVNFDVGFLRFNLRKPKKDGTPSNGGRIEYYVGLSEIQPIEMVAIGEKA